MRDDVLLEAVDVADVAADDGEVGFDPDAGTANVEELLLLF